MSDRLYIFTDNGEKVVGTLADWAVRWKDKPGTGHRRMSYYLLSWDGESPPFLHYIKIGKSRSGVRRIRAHGVPGHVDVPTSPAT